jgi:MFS family permease
MMGTTLPTPLYPIYERAYGFGPLMVTVVFAAYAFGVLAGLLFFGHMSDELGRRPVLVGGLVLSALSALAFLFAHDMTAIFAGRIFSGLSAGVFTGSATAALVDLAPIAHRGRAAVIAVAANIGGLGLGTLLSGLLGQYAPSPLRLVYAVDFVLVCIGIACVLSASETVTQRRALRLRVQRLRIPAEIRGVFLQAAILGMCGFAVAGLFSAIAPSLMASLLQEPNHALAGLLVFALMGMTAVGQIVVRRFSRQTALFASCALLLLGMMMLAASLEWRMATLLFASAIVEGVGMGLGIGSGLAEINERIHERRGEVSSAYFVLLYIGLAFPVIGVGFLATHVGLRNAGLIFAAIIAAVLLAVMAAGAKKVRVP